MTTIRRSPAAAERRPTQVGDDLTGAANTGAPAITGQKSVTHAHNGALQHERAADSYTRDGGPRAVGVPTRADVRERKPVALIEHNRIDIDVPASGVLVLGEGRYLFVDDDKGIYIQHPNDAEKLKCSRKHEELIDLEGICRTPNGDAVLVVSEERGEVFRLDIKGDGEDIDLGKPKKLGRLPKLGKNGSNKGWEGIDIIPARFFDDGKPRMVAVHEADPRRIGVFSYPDLDDALLFRVPRDIESHLTDLSDITVDPQTGHLFVLSDECSVIAEFALAKKTKSAPGALLETLALETVGLHAIDTKRVEKPEGLDFGPDGRLYVSTDGRARLIAFDVER